MRPPKHSWSRGKPTDCRPPAGQIAGGYQERKVMTNKSPVDQDTLKAQANQKWGRFIEDLMSSREVERLEWYAPTTTADVLDEIGHKLRGLHSTFLPGGGCLEITGACIGLEDGAIQLEVEDGRYMYAAQLASLVCVI